MLRKHKARLVVFAIVLAVAAGVAFFAGVMGMPIAVRVAIRNRQLREIALTAHNYSENRVFPPRRPIPHDTYSGYFVSNKFEPDATQSFLVITDQAQFDKVFGIAMVMGDKAHRLPLDIFKSNIVVAAIKRGKAVWEFKVEGVTVADGILELRYTTAAKHSDSASFACPLIVSIPQGKYKAVRFVENGKPVMTMAISEK